MIVEFECPLGKWCTAGLVVPCPLGTYNNETGQDFATACKLCPANSHTLNESSVSLDDCVCDAEFYDAIVGPGVECALCPVGTNLRELALAEDLELYGLKGRLGNCGGCGQCITCFVEVVAERSSSALTPRTPVEDQKLRRRPESWRLACQALVQESIAVLTRPQNRRDAQAAAIAAAQQEPLPEGRMPEPEPDPEAEEEMEQTGAEENDEL